MISRFKTLLLLAFFTCKSKESELNVMPQSVGNYVVLGEGWTFSLDFATYQRLNFTRKNVTSCQAPFRIKRINRSGEELKIEVSRPASCELSYELVWDGVIMERNPSRIQIYLTAQSDFCKDSDRLESDFIVLDLFKVIKGVSQDNLQQIYLREYCSFRDFNCIGDCDMEITE